MSEISNDNLTILDIPKFDAGWGEIGRFALTFNGYDFHGGIHACGEIANQWLEAYEKNGTYPTTLTDLRTCLFFEQRRWRHYGYEPDENTMRYVRGLISGIRAICEKLES